MLEVLVADDDEIVRRSIVEALEEAGHRVAEARDGVEAIHLLASHAFDLAVCDVQMPRLDGLALFRRIRVERPETAVVLMTSYGRIGDAIGALREGATDYVTKPFDPIDFAERVVSDVVRRRDVARRLGETRLRRSVEPGPAIVGLSPAMRRLAREIDDVAHERSAVAVIGEAGTGKKLAATRIHVEGARRDGPCVIVDCADARLRLEDLLRDAACGTIVFDRIDALPIEKQSELARLLDSPWTRPRRDGRVEIGVRVVSTSTRDLAVHVADGRLVRRLHFHLDGAIVRVPPLRHRDGDLYLLVSHFLRALVATGAIPPSLSSRAWKSLSAYAFPGNVTELRSILDRAVNNAGPRPHGWGFGDAIDVELPSA